jgi:hypothetical protein
VHDSEGVLGPDVIEFVEHHVSTLLAWDIVVFFHRNADVRLEVEDLAARLGRHAEEIMPEIDALCDGDVLACDLGVIRYEPLDPMHAQVDRFVAACQDRGQRLALIALVLGRMGRRAAGSD